MNMNEREWLVIPARTCSMLVHDSSRLSRDQRIFHNPFRINVHQRLFAVPFPDVGSFCQQVADGMYRSRPDCLEKS